ncbi:hypothetical protein [Lentibacillus cibarius]|uniref:Uncharacterized protein n=1 Tax=Lentibacillus cibarius TaxID=2583219 RepID=A0A5S3QJS9_9BACI|nr:hypothetical protein [Lentibacillus cibarius]TMN22115.1 hypothetical protein FFL34_08240 [Lentibacillus cibarius]
MDKKKLITAIIGFVLLIGVTMFAMNLETTASQEKQVDKFNDTFTGESEHWSAQLHVTGEKTYREGKDDDRAVFKLTYKGPIRELSSVNKLRYQYVMPTSSKEIKMTFDTPPENRVFTDSSSNLVKQDAMIKVSVQWGDHTETFTLRAEG